jgi:hypothetical protein
MPFCFSVRFFSTSSVIFILHLFAGCHMASNGVLQAWSPGISKISQTNMLSSPLKSLTTYGTHVLPLFNCHGWKKNLFSQLYVHVRCFLQCWTAHYVIKALILWSWQRCFLCLCTYHIHSICIIKNYQCIQVYVHICTCNGCCCTHCIHGRATSLVRRPYVQEIIIVKQE